MLFFSRLNVCVCAFVCVCVLRAGAGEEVPANCGLPQHEGDSNQEERADQRD